jgi:hypothetical protein
MLDSSSIPTRITHLSPPLEAQILGVLFDAGEQLVVAPGTTWEVETPKGDLERLTAEDLRLAIMRRERCGIRMGPRARLVAVDKVTSMGWGQVREIGTEAGTFLAGRLMLPTVG